MRATTAPRRSTIGLTAGIAVAVGALALSLTGCADAGADTAGALAPAASPTPSIAAASDLTGSPVSGVGPVDFPGGPFPIPDGARSVVIAFERDGDGPFTVELGDTMALRQAPIGGTCGSLAELAGPILFETRRLLTVYVGDGVAWTATPHFSAAEFQTDAALATDCEGFSAVYSAFTNADSGYGAYGAFGEPDPAHPRRGVRRLMTTPPASAEDPGPTLTFDKAVHDLYDEYYVLGATIAAMPTGTRMSLHDALATMLIPSASNYAEAVSNWAFGSPGGYRAAARAWLAKHDLTGTTIVEAAGISPRNTSTTADLMKIAALAAADPTIAALCATTSLTLPAPGTMHNTNGLLGVDGIDGLKTGNLGAGTFALAYTADLDVGIGAPLGITGVSLSGSSRDAVDAAVQRLLASIRAGFHRVTVATDGTVLGVFETPWGSFAQLVIDGSASLLTWSDTPISVTMDAEAPKAYADGEKVGTLTWTAGPETVSLPVVVKGDIAPPDDWWRLTHPSELG